MGIDIKIARWLILLVLVIGVVYMIKAHRAVEPSV